MAEFPSVHLVDDTIPTAAQLNAAARAASRAHMTMLGLSAFKGVQPADGTGAVFGGLKVSAVSGTMRSQVSAGTGIYVDSSAFTSPLSPFGLVLLEAANTTTLTHATADATNPRYDIVCIRTQAGTQNEVSVADYPSGSTPRDTIRGPEVDLAITAGTPAGSPSVPATPAGYIKLAEVYVPALAADAVNFQYVDVRPMRPMSGGTMRAHLAGGLNYDTDSFTAASVGAPDGFAICMEQSTGNDIIYLVMPSTSAFTVAPTVTISAQAASAATLQVPRLGVFGSGVVDGSLQTDLAAATPAVTAAIGQPYVSWNYYTVVTVDGTANAHLAAGTANMSIVIDIATA